MNAEQRKTLQEAIELYAQATPRSRGVHTPNVVFQTARPTVGMYPADFDNDPKTAEWGMVDLEAGIKVRLMQCDTNKESGVDVYYIDGKYMRIPARDMIHVSGELGPKMVEIYATEAIVLS